MPRPSSRCKSCRRLKIACDQKRPRCEYCIATNRDCVYDFLSPNKYTQSQPQSLPSTSSNDKDRYDSHSLSEDYASDGSFSNPDFSPELLLYNHLRLNSAYRQLGVSRFEYRLLNVFHCSVAKHALHGSKEFQNFPPWLKVWVTELPDLWHQRVTIRQSINSFVLMALKEEVNLNELLIEDVFQDETQESHSLPLFENSAFEGSMLQEGLYEALLQKIRTVTNQDLDTRAMEYFGKFLKETSRLIQTVTNDDTQLDPYTAFEMFIASSGLYTFLTMQPYGIMPLISFGNEQNDLLNFIVPLRSATEKVFNLIFNSRYQGILSLNEKLLPKPRITESYVITEELYRQFQEYQAQKPEQDHFTDQIISGIRWFEIAIYRAIDLNDVAAVPHWLRNVDVELYDLMHRQHYFSLKLLYYHCAIIVIYGLTAHKRTNIFLDYLRWFELINQGNHHWQQYDQDLYEVIQNELSLTDLNQLKTFNPADHLFKEYTFV